MTQIFLQQYMIYAKSFCEQSTFNPIFEIPWPETAQTIAELTPSYPFYL